MNTTAKILTVLLVAAFVMIGRAAEGASAPLNVTETSVLEDHCFPPTAELTSLAFLDPSLSRTMLVNN